MRSPPERIFLNMQTFTGKVGIAHSRAPRHPSFIREGWRSMDTLPPSGIVLLLFRNVLDFGGYGPRDQRIAIVELHESWWAVTGLPSPQQGPVSDDALGWFPLPLVSENET